MAKERSVLTHVLDLFEGIAEFCDTIERLVSVGAGLVLAVLLSSIPLLDFETGEPWYFWVGSGLIALTASILLAWILFPRSGSPEVPPEEDTTRQA
ncbi:MAG: hypothetical protein AB7K24_11885 [Gemmataceae bacterium]